MSDPCHPPGTNGHCPEPRVCPLSQARAGAFVRIKQLSGSDATVHRLREMGFCEEQRVKLLLKHTNTTVICQVCNVRVGLSSKLADSILVETFGGQPPQPK